MNVTRHSCHIGKLSLIGRRVKGDKSCIRWTHACIDPERWMELMQWVFQIWLSFDNKCRQGTRIHKSPANEGERESSPLNRIFSSVSGNIFYFTPSVYVYMTACIIRRNLRNSQKKLKIFCICKKAFDTKV